MKAASPYLTTEEAAMHARFTHADGSPNLHAFACFRSRLKKRGKALRTYRRAGGRVYFKQCDLDALFEEEKPAKATAVPGSLRGLRMVR